MRRALGILALTAAMAGCGGGAPRADTCPEMTPGYVPPGLGRVERSLTGDSPKGVLVVYRDRSGSRELSFLSGVPSEPHGGTAAGQVTVRGHRARLLVDEAVGTRQATWLEAPAGEPCAQYTVTSVGLTAEEFDRVVAAIG